VRRFGRQKVLAAWKSRFATIVRLRGGNAFTLLAAVRGFLGKRSTAEAVKWLQKQEHCDEAKRDVNAAAHSLLQDTRSLGQPKLFAALRPESFPIISP
jgi:hypothetical protein